MNHVPVQSTLEFVLKPSCEIATNKRVIRTGLILDIEGGVKRWPWLWNVSNVLFDMNMQTLDKLVTELKLADNHPTSIRDLRKQIFMNGHQTINSWLSAAIIFLTFLVLCILGYLLVRYVKLRRTKDTNETP